MTERQILLIKNSWSQVVPLAHEAGILFYDQLFKIAPELKGMFKSDIQSQAKKLTAMLTFVVSKLQCLDEIIDQVKALADRHVDYGTNKEHFLWVGVALIRTLKLALQENWNSELEEAWGEAYNTLADAMIAQIELKLSSTH